MSTSSELERQSALESVDDLMVLTLPQRSITGDSFLVPNAHSFSFCPLLVDAMAIGLDKRCAIPEPKPSIRIFFYKLSRMESLSARRFL